MYLRLPIWGDIENKSTNSTSTVGWFLASISMVTHGFSILLTMLYVFTVKISTVYMHDCVIHQLTTCIIHNK